MVETTISTKKHILIYGLLIGAIWIIYGVLRHVTDNRTTSNWAFSTFELVLHICIISYTIYKYKFNNDNFLTLWQSIKIGIGISAISALLLISWDIFFLKFISPETLKEIVNPSNSSTLEELTEQNRGLSEESTYFIKRSTASLIYHLTFGLIISMLSGAIMQKNPDPFD